MLLLLCVHEPTSYPLLASAVGLIYLVQTGIPLPPITGLVFRGSVAVMVGGLIGIGEASALASTFVLWMANVATPALVGFGCLMYWGSKLDYTKTKTDTI